MLLPKTHVEFQHEVIMRRADKPNKREAPNIMAEYPDSRSRHYMHRPVTHVTVRRIANTEATSFLVLLVCMLFKYAGPKVDGPVMIMGWVHGLLFLTFLYVIVRARATLGWTTKRTWLAVGSSVVPLAPYFLAHTEPDQTTTS